MDHFPCNFDYPRFISNATAKFTNKAANYTAKTLTNTIYTIELQLSLILIPDELHHFPYNYNNH